ncbi:rhamnogalacturonan acetylesterase [Catenovulum agarivorans]|uniref:rhamnogalacturonan acetylesterase n=1 Tax=Catenovulum agarivorans TaxID=1172192 RepID=UPI0002FFA37D|nr:rhamnogalacturonan acetylesterase [Catenovulum agarivorans]
MKKQLSTLFISLALTFSANINAQTLVMAGDSTMQDVDPERGPDFGWGQLLPTLKNADSSLKISNHAKGGRSTRTFIEEQRWQAVIDEAQAGDWVVIQFGHNDASYHKQDRYTAPVDYKVNLERMVLEVRQKHAFPVLITPVMRRYFDGENKLKDAHGIYPSLVREVAREQNVPMIDLMKSSGELLTCLGPEQSKSLFMSVEPGEHPRYPEGKQDNTHFSKFGAVEIGKLVIREAQANWIQLFTYNFKQPEETISQQCESIQKALNKG